MINQNESENSLDQEWFKLILKAKELGISPVEIRNFLRNPKSISNGIKSANPSS